MKKDKIKLIIGMALLATCSIVFAADDTNLKFGTIKNPEYTGPTVGCTYFFKQGGKIAVAPGEPLQNDKVYDAFNINGKDVLLLNLLSAQKQTEKLSGKYIYQGYKLTLTHVKTISSSEGSATTKANLRIEKNGKIRNVPLIAECGD